ncbi:hypothetical protein [Peredibacter starrii]|uniref:Uncharacterized protein n=1 Tax=Peredibacter starrii TaxID=28202 RepID=A0AAX4HTH7_9BACT|nr:hypothetical protein [Peredibacter starrii]WPU66664.1 hypothetical protein SOO65_07890 [Peredibacter starrii]
MRLLAILSVIFCLAAHAEDHQKQIWMKGEEYFLFSYQASTNILISESCIPLDKLKCDAAKALKKKHSLQSPKTNVGGKNPGAIVCKDLLKKEIRILKNHKDDENSFCVFEDGSMISAINLQSLLKE